MLNVPVGVKYIAQLLDEAIAWRSKLHSKMNHRKVQKQTLKICFSVFVPYSWRNLFFFIFLPKKQRLDL
jgi:hypothetical protein